MASSVFYKFASQRSESRVTFDGTGISVFDLKREIILANNLSKANDFDLVVLDATSKQEFKDDSHIIPRSSSIVVKRVPAARPGKGKASVYVSGVGPTANGDASRAGATTASATPPTWNRAAMSKRFDGKDDSAGKTSMPPPPVPAANIPANSITTEDENAALAAMFQAQTANWEETQEKMSHAQRIFTNPRGTGFQRGGKTPFHGAHHQNDRPLPPSYVCYRCGQKGHWIQDCPTNSDREFDNRPRIKRTTGIPRSMLKAVANPGGSEMTQGVMVTPEGSYVVAQPDLASWQKKTHRSAGLTVEQVRERAPTDAALVCPIDNKLFRDAVKTPCCEKTYCEECVQTHLLERDFVCPNCSKKVPSLDKLVADKSMRAKVVDYIDKAIEESRKELPEELMNKDAGSTGENSATSEAVNTEQDIYSDQQQPQQDDLGLEGMTQLVEHIPQLQASIAQLSVMLQNPSLPNQVRQATEMQLNQLQMELGQAQTFQAALAAATSLQQSGAFNNMNPLQGFQQQGATWNTGQFGNQQQQQQQQAGQDSAYQRLPVNNRRRNLKRDRPSDFLEVGGENDAKVARYWE